MQHQPRCTPRLDERLGVTLQIHCRTCTAVVRCDESIPQSWKLGVSDIKIVALGAISETGAREKATFQVAYENFEDLKQS